MAGIFGLVIEVHAKGLYRVLTDVNKAISDHFASRPLRDLYFGPWTEERQAGALATATFAV